MERRKPRNLIKLVEKQMIELESTTDRDRLCMLNSDQNASSYPSIIWNVLDKMYSDFSC